MSIAWLLQFDYILTFEDVGAANCGAPTTTGRVVAKLGGLNDELASNCLRARPTCVHSSDRNNRDATG